MDWYCLGIGIGIAFDEAAPRARSDKKERLCLTNRKPMTVGIEQAERKYEMCFATNQNNI